MSTIVYPTEKILELAFAAQRVNDNYVKHSSHVNYNDISEEIIWSNRELIFYTATKKLAPADTAFLPYVPKDFKELEVIDSDRNGVARTHNFFRRYTMIVLGNSLSEFQYNMYKVYSQKEVSIESLGYLAYLPSFINNESDDITYKRKLKTEYSESVHLQGSSFRGNIEILKRIFLQKWNTFFYFAGTSNKLICFCKKNKYEVGSALYITARIKSKDIEQETQLPLTRVNYVKEFQTEKN